MHTDVDVAIVGCGPVGALLGNLLGLRGHSVLIAEKQPEPYPLPRAIHFDGEVMRVFQSALLEREVAPATLVGKGMLFKDREGKVLVDWSRDQKPGPTGWYESYRFHQPTLEAALRAGLDRFPAVRLREGCTVTGFRQGAEGVELTLQDGGRVAARYAVGCDGAGSTIAGLIGAGYDDLGFDERWLVCDVLLTGPEGDLGDHSIQFCDADAPATYVRGPADRRRWEARLMPDDPNDIEPLTAWAQLAMRRGLTGCAVERAAIYRFRSRVTRDWRSASVFLAGDAAHQTPPFMGQGMCAGVRDAANLAWKLSARLAGRGDDDLLQSYGSERAPNVTRFIERAVALGRLINQTAAGAVPPGRMSSIWPPLGPGLGPRDGIGGTLWPQHRNAAGELSDTAAGHGFHVIAARTLDSRLPVIVADSGEMGTETLGVVVRPDGYALAAFASLAELRALEDTASRMAPAAIETRHFAA